MNWQAKWIWAESLVDTPNCYVYARREFEVDSAPSAEACVTCSSEYRLYANGRYIGRGPNPCRPAFQNYDTHDISHILRSGKNVIAAICYNYGVQTHSRPQTPGGFLLQLEIEHNGEKQIVATDETWKARPADDWDFGSTRMSPTIGFQEVYDSRRKPVGWNVVGFDDTAWQDAFVIGDVGCEPWTSLIPRQIPPLKEWDLYPRQVLSCGTVSPIDDSTLDVATRMRREQTHADDSTVRYPKELLCASGEVAIVNPGPDSFIVLDFGMEVVGFAGIRLRSAGHATIDIGYGETLDENGGIDPTRQGICQADRLILHGGRQEWQTFGRRAFRYVQLTARNLDQPALIESVYVSRVGYPVEHVSTFKCSDDTLNEIWRVGVYTLSVCMQDSYESCPLGTGIRDVDAARVQALINYYCFFDSALAAQALEQLARSPDNNLIWVEMLHDYYLHTADLGLVEQLYPDLRLLIEDRAHSDESEDAAHCAFYYQALRDASKLAAAVSNTEDSLAWHERAGHMLSTFNDRFWCDQKGAYVTCGDPGAPVSVRASILAIVFGLADVGKCSRTWDYLSSSETDSESTPYFGFYVLQAMARLDKTAEALDLIRSKWGEMLRRGATTWWESFPSDDVPTCPDSLCSGSSGAPTYFLPAEVLGVKPSTAGGGVTIQPRVGDLSWASGTIKTVSGLAEVEWRIEDGVFRIDVEAPEGFIVGLPVGGFVNPVVDEIDLTPETPERRARRTYGWGTTIWRDGVERDSYIDWLATQESEPPPSYKPTQRCSTDQSYIWVRESVSTHVRYEIREG